MVLVANTSIKLHLLAGIYRITSQDESKNTVTHVPTGMAVFIQDDRTQHTNKAKALAILKERLFAIEVTKKQENLHSQRKDQMASGDRSDKIRTYNFPQSRISGIFVTLWIYLIPNNTS